MEFREFILKEHPDPDTLLYPNFDQMCKLAERYVEMKLRESKFTHPC